MSEHECKACIVFCMDFRLHEGLAGFMKDEELDWHKADIIRVDGAAKTLAQPKEPRDRAFVLEQLQISYGLHNVRQFYLINHEDCGAYGPEADPDRSDELNTHMCDLKAAKLVVEARFPADIEVIPCFIWLNGRVDRIEA